MFHVKQTEINLQGEFNSRDFVIKTLNLSENVSDKLDCYVALLNEWQSKMNLVSSSTLPEVWTRHILDSGQIFKFVKPSDKMIFDFGSGAGFPALVLAIMDENRLLDVHCAESDGKKCQFLKAVIDECGLNVVVHNERIEKISVPPVDVITARALASLDKLMGYAFPFMSNKTRCLFLKGKKVPEEIKEAEKKWKFSTSVHSSLSSPEGRILEISNVRKK